MDESAEHLPMGRETKRTIYISWGLGLVMVAIAALLAIYNNPLWVIAGAGLIGLALILHGSLPHLFTKKRLAVSFLGVAVAFGLFWGGVNFEKHAQTKKAETTKKEPPQPPPSTTSSNQPTTPSPSPSAEKTLQATKNNKTKIREQAKAGASTVPDSSTAPSLTFNAPVQGNVAGVNNGQQTFNQLGEPPSVKQVIAEVSTTCVLTDLKRIPSNVVMSVGSEDSYISGSAGKELLTDGAYTFTKPTDDGTVVARQEFSLIPTSSLIGKPTANLFSGYNLLHVVNYAVSGGYFKECTGLSVTLKVNGDHVMQTEKTLRAHMDNEHGLSFDIGLTAR